MRAALWDASDYADIAAEQWENGPADEARDMLSDFRALRVNMGLRVAGTGWGHYVTRMPRASKLRGLVKPWAVRRSTWSRLLVLIWRAGRCGGWELGFHVGDMSVVILGSCPLLDG